MHKIPKEGWKTYWLKKKKKKKSQQTSRIKKWVFSMGKGIAQGHIIKYTIITTNTKS